MAGRDGQELGVWQQLRRRRVTRTVVSYLCVGFAGREAVWLLAPGPITVRVVMGALVLGFPLAVVLAWTYDLTPDGIVRTPDDPSPASGPWLSRVAWLLMCAGTIALGMVLRAIRT